MMYLGFSEEALFKVSEMLDHAEINWPAQFRTGRGPGPENPENYHTGQKKGKSIEGDLQKMLKGQKTSPSEGLSPVALPKGNPQQGPRSRTLDGLAMFTEDTP